jgi:N-acetylglucosamine-6-phosphate deacetylase
MVVKAVLNGKVVTSQEVIHDGVVLIEGNTIIGCGSRAEVEIPVDAELVDAGGCYVGPGFIDIHCHGGGGYWAHLNPYEFACAHLKFGTTGILPTLSYNESREEVWEGVNRILNAGGKPYSSAILGIHMEGPYINPKYEAITSPIRPVDPTEYNRLLELAGDRIKLWTLAPELEGQEQFAAAAAAHGIVLSVGHSEATAETIFSFVEKGLRVGCHCTNATGATPSPSRYAGTREVGVDEAILLHDEIYAEVIPDSSGAHVRPLMCKLILKTKGIDRVIIITDAMDTAGLSDNKTSDDPGKRVGAEPLDVNFNHNGVLSGSLLTMNRAVRNMKRYTGVGMVESFRMASLNPARVLNLDHTYGSVEPGKRANLVLVSEEFEVSRVIFEGEIL